MDRKREEQLRLIKSALQTGKRLAGAKRRTYKGKTLIHRIQQENYPCQQSLSQTNSLKPG